MEEDYSLSCGINIDDHVYKKKKKSRIINISCRKLLGKGLFQLLLLLGFVWLLLVNVNDVNLQENNYASTIRRRIFNQHANSSSSSDQDQQRRIIRKLDFINVVSKRKVPRGPDPIHNRRAGNSHQPPGRA